MDQKANWSTWAKVGAFLPIWSIGIATVYLLGYWPAFGINILQYGGIADVAYSAVFPLMGALFILLITFAAGQATTSKTFRLFEAKRAQIDRIVSNHGEWVLGFWIIVSVLIMLTDHQRKWDLFPILVAIPFVVLLVKLLSSNALIQINSYTIFAIFLFAYIPPFSFYLGHQRGSDIIDGYSFSYLEESLPQVKFDKQTTIVEQRPRFLGHVGNYNFFYDPRNKAVTIAKEHDDVTVSIKRYTRPQSLNNRSLLDKAAQHLGG